MDRERRNVIYKNYSNESLKEFKLKKNYHTKNGKLLKKQKKEVPNKTMREIKIFSED